MDQPTKVTVIAGGMEYSAFTQIAVQYAANQAVRTFAITLTDDNGLAAAWVWMPGTEVTIFANGHQLTQQGLVGRLDLAAARAAARIA